ncbi:MAG: ATP-binding cassette domain-containing protein [Clostridia bacterium]|nr:ATP-binding cassette domain-containing protein [Clostridia bacterium]
MIEVSGLYKRYGNHVAVKNASFSIKKGEIIGFLGPNGAGKSTIMNILTGYLSATQGTATIDGFDIMDNPLEAKRRIGYLPEIPPLYTDMTVREYLEFMYGLKKVKLPKKPHIDEICKIVKIEDVQHRLIKNLSKGYRQRVGIAQALVGNPDVLILDEPTVGLDPKQIIEIRNLIARLGKTHTVILSSHILSEIQAVCERVIIINRGVIIADATPEDLSAKLSEDKSLVLRVSGPESEILKTLQTINGVAEVESLGQRESGTVDFHITPKDTADVRREIFERLSNRNWPIYMLTSNALTLEQIFLRLTEMPVEEPETDELVGLDNQEDTEDSEKTDKKESEE